MTQEIAKFNPAEPAIPQNAVALRSLNDVKNAATVLFQSGYFKSIKNVQQAIVKMMVGMEIGITPMAAMAGVYIVNDKPALEGKIMAAKIKASGKYNYKIVETTDKICTIDFYEKWDGNTWEKIGSETFTMQDAQTAELTSNMTYKKYPKAMLRWRALSAGARVHCPDAFNGVAVYTPDELNPAIEVDDTGKVINYIEPEIKDNPLAPGRHTTIEQPKDETTFYKTTDEEAKEIAKGQPVQGEYIPPGNAVDLFDTPEPPKEETQDDKLIKKMHALLNTLVGRDRKKRLNKVNEILLQNGEKEIASSTELNDGLLRLVVGELDYELNGQA